MSVPPARVSNRRSANVGGADARDGSRPGADALRASVVETGRGRQIIALDVDVVRTPANEPLPKRLLMISETVSPSPGAAVNGHSIRGPVVEALVGLGFAARQAEEATTSTALRSALSLLGKTK
jgi:hypothetical protein